MTKKMLFIFPGYYGFNDVILDGFKKYTDYEIVNINPVNKYKYKNFFEKALNAFAKIFLNINLKKKYFIEKSIIKTIKDINNVDVLFVNRPDLLSTKALGILQNKCPNRIALYWDSFDKIPETFCTLKFFNKPFTFDSLDSKKYNIPLISNFYLEQNNENKNNTEYDFFFLGTYDARYDTLLLIFDKLVEKGFRCGGIIFHEKLSTIINKKDYLNYTNKTIPFKKSFSIAKNSKYILDLSHSNQRGLSFRVFEAISLNKKLITTNKEVYNQDFYSENNIFVLEDIYSDIPNSFLSSEYQKIDKKIIEKYSQRLWVQRILN